MSIQISAHFSLAAITVFLTSASAAMASPELPGDLKAGEKIYMSNCEVCHLIGRNLLNPNKEIQNSKLIDDPKKLKEWLSHKNGKMPAFADLAKDDEKLKHLSEFLHYARKHPSEVEKETEAELSKEHKAPKSPEKK